MAGGRQSRRFLESAEDYFLVQVPVRLTRVEALLDLVLTNAEVIASFESQDPGMAWVGRDIKVYLKVQTPAVCWLPPTRSGCLKPYPVRP